MLENRYILDNPTNREWLQASLKQAKDGQVAAHHLVTPSADDE